MTNRYTRKRKNTGKETGEKGASFSKDRSSEEIGSKKEPPKEPAQEVKKEPEEQIPGQTEITKDFPEYCPDNMEVPAEITEEEEIKRAYATRRLYMASIPAQEAAEYMAKVMDKKMRSMRGVSFAALGKEEFWTELLEAEVDKNGEEIECVEQCAN